MLPLCAATLMLVVVSCGDNDKGASDACGSKATYSVADVASAFEAVTGRQLQIGRSLDLRRMGGGVTVGLTPGDDERAKYGEFRFVVQTTCPRNPVFDAISRPGDPELPGHVYLVRRVQEGRPGRTGPPWAAWKYIGNVKLVWFTDARKLDERWAVLDQVLERLKTGAQSERTSE